MWVKDENGKDYIESVAGLWCASLGFDNERFTYRYQGLDQKLTGVEQAQKVVDKSLPSNALMRGA